MTNHDDGKRTPAQIAQLFEIAGHETEAVRQLDGCVTMLNEVQQAKEALKSLTPAEVREALEYRRLTLCEPT